MTTSTDPGTPGRSTSAATGRRRAGGQGESPPDAGEVEQAVCRDLEEIGERDAGLARSALAMSAVALAKEIDKPGNSATSKSMCARVLLDTLETLRFLAPQEETDDDVDRLNRRRTARLIEQAQGAKN